jgi:hypothetical protein
MLDVTVTLSQEKADQVKAKVEKLVEEMIEFPNFFSPEALEISTDGSCDCCKFSEMKAGDLFFDTPDGPPERFIKTAKCYAINLDAGYLAEFGSSRMVYYWGKSAEEKAIRKIRKEDE